jgi:malate permease and related proteins
MENVLLIFVCLLIGFGLQKVSVIPKNAHVTLNQFVIYVSLPALALFYIPKIILTLSLLYPLGIAWIGFGLAFLFFSFLGKRWGWSKKLTGCLILTAGLGNTSFVGFPIIEALYGKEGLQTAIIVDQPGSFVVMSTLGVWVATVFSSGFIKPSQIFRRIAFFPPFIAFVIAVMMSILNLDFPESLQSVFSRLGQTVTPIALVSVGLQLSIDSKSKHFQFLALGLFFKLMLMPLFFLIFYHFVLGGNGLVVEVSIIESAMAPMITGAILASSFGLKPRLSSMMVGVGIPLSLITIGIWYLILQGLQIS